MPPSKTWIQLELTNLQQLNQLPNLDSLLGQSLLAIKGVVDSTPMDNIARRIDAVPRDQKVEIRTTSHESNQNTLVYQQGSLSNLKIERDTLRITFYTGGGNDMKRQLPGFITVQVNFLQDLYALPLHVMDSCVELARKHFTEELIKGIGWRARVTATFDLSQGLMIIPGLEMSKKLGKRAYNVSLNNEGTFLPAIYGSLQYVRGMGRGNWFEPNTFKFSLPGVRNYTLQVEPEFYFNGFFKNFSPSLRFSLFFE